MNIHTEKIRVTTPKILQIIPAPAGSYIAAIRRKGKPDESAEVSAAACIALVEDTCGEDTFQYIYPLGFAEGTDSLFGETEVTIHPSKKDADAYLKCNCKNWRSLYV